MLGIKDGTKISNLSLNNSCMAKKIWKQYSLERRYEFCMVYEQFEVAIKWQLELGQTMTDEAEAKAGITMCSMLEELLKADPQIRGTGRFQGVS